MNSSDLVKAIKHLKPSAEFVLNDGNYETIKWIVLDGEAPTFAELEAAHLEVEAVEEAAKAEIIVKRQAILDRLGITEQEAKLLLG
jgi:hypothetical protein